MAKKLKRIVVVLVVVIFSFLLYIMLYKEKTEEIMESNSNSIIEYSGYTFEHVEGSIINKTFKGEKLESFITIATVEDVHRIYLKGIDEESNVSLINPLTGEALEFQREGLLFKLDAKLEPNIIYGVIKDFSLVGAIRVVNNINEIDEYELYKETIIGVGCGL